jgi:hypothetical protein
MSERDDAPDLDVACVISGASLHLVDRSGAEI